MFSPKKIIFAIILFISTAILISGQTRVHVRKDTCSFSTFRLGQNRGHVADDNLQHIFLKENIWISIKISRAFVPGGQINNQPALVQIMAWRRTGDKPLFEPMLVRVIYASLGPYVLDNDHPVCFHWC